MSGSGGGGYTPPQRTEFDCKTGIIRTTISSVNIAVLNKHNTSDILDVELSDNKTLILVDGDGEILGSILHLNTLDIIKCIENGNEYEAEIISITYPACTVIIKRK